MKKIFGFRSKKGMPSFDSSISPGRDRGHHRTNFQPRNHIRDKDLGEIHKAASVGDVAKVQQVLLLGKSGLNDKDKLDRTALHLACANGHPAVVALLLERKCLLNLCDSENRTALMKAVECQEEECATLLLEHGADPNVRDACGNTALHYAVLCQNSSLAAKLLSYNACIEARNKDDLTPLLVAIRERRGHMVEFLVKKEANIHAVDKMKRTALMLAVKYESENVVRLLLQQGVDIFSQDVFGWTAEEYAVISGFNIFHQLISEYKEKRPKTSPEKSNPADESSEEDSSRRFPNKPGVDLGPTSNDEVLGFQTKHVLKSNITKLMKASQQSKRNIEAKCGIWRPESTTFSEDSNSDGNTEDVGETFPRPSPWFEGICQPAFPSSQPVAKLLKSVAGLGCTKQSISESLPQKYVDHLPGASGQRGKKTLNGQVEDSPGKYPNVKPTVRMKDSVPNQTVRMKDLQTSSSDLSRELDLEMITKEEQDKLDEDENNHSQVEEEKKHKSSEVEVSDNVCDAANEKGLIEQRRSGGNSNQEFPAMQNEDSYRPARITPHEKKKVKEQINYVNDLDDLTQSSETVSEDDDMLYSTISTLQVEPLDVGCKDFDSLLKIRDAIFSYERLVDFQRSHCELLRGKIYKMKSKVCGLQKELSETKEVKSQLEHQKVELELELSSLRFALKQEEEKRRNTNMSYEKIREQLRRVEDEHSKEIEMKQQLEFSLRALEMELKTVRNNWNQASAGHEEAKDLLRKNHILQEEIASLRLEIDAVKSQNLEKERNYFEDIEIVKAKSDDAQKVVKLTEEMLTKTISQDTGQPNVLAAANMMLKSKLENKKESKQRLETEVKSYRSKLAAASHDPDRGQTSPRDLELAFQRAKDEWLCLQDKMESDVANLKDNSKALSQQLSTVEHKFNKLKIKLQRTRDDLREKTLTLERVQRDLHQAECQKQEAEHMYRNEQGKVNEYLGKQESLEERLSQLQSENMLLRQQLDDVQNKAGSKEKTVIGIQDQFQQIVRKLHAESEKQGLMLEERNKELISERNHLKERLCQYENKKAEREADVRQLRQELADTVKKQSMSEASLEVMSRYCANLDDETQDLKNNFRQLTSQRQAESQQVELRIKDLESELSKMKTLQEDNKAEFETYKHLYLVEFEVRKSLQDELDKTNERPAEISTKLEVEKQQKRSLLSTPSSTLVLEPSSVGNFNPTSGFNANLLSRAIVGFSTSIPHRSNDSVETYLTKVKHRQRKELGSVQLTEHPLKAALGPQHPSSSAPGVPLALRVATIFMRTAEICLPVSELHTGGYIYSACSVHALVLLLGNMSAVCIQRVQVSVHLLCLSVFFVSPVVVFHCLTGLQFIYPFSLSTSGSFPIFF
ncbi:ankyrin repeat domain-containing protein 26-like isoform X5 [Cervus canadensis]|uniref:ankyrin repeat domain-containing protein 26-like isoform X5 n=1 Tax=Cervus canadensis TaxID=1574408 RepID=UPI001C9E7FE4|nr:ankyrin repeat domain-containing protein 26-like isoform X5 [Cervus canadensis]